MALTIDNLEIQIQAEASRATSGIENLARSMRELKIAVGDSSGLASNLVQIASALKTFNGVGKINLTGKINQLNKLQELIPTLGGAGATQLANNLREIAGALIAFSAIPKLNVNVGSIAKAIQELNTVTASFDASRLAQFSAQMKGIADGLSQLSFVGKTNIGSLVNSLKRIPEITAALDPATVQAFADAIKRLSSILGPLAWQMDAIARGFNALPFSIRRTTKETDRQTRANYRLRTSFNGLFTRISFMASNFWTLYYTVSRVADVFADWFNESSEYIESLNLFNVSLGDAADSAFEYAQTVSDAMGIDVAEWITNQGTFTRMATGFGIAADQATLMGQNLTQLAYDMSSFFNTDVETAMQKIQSGMSGQIKGLKAWGYNLSVAALQETALRLGLEQSVRTMTEAQKAQLRYITLIHKSNGIMGDMGKTILSPSNSMRVLKAQLVQLERALGNIISVLVVKFIPWMKAATELITEFANSLAEAWGFEVMEFPDVDLDLGSEVEEETDKAEDAINELKKQLMGFDELNILKNPKDEEDEGPRYDLGIDLPHYNFMENLEKIDLEPYKQKLQDIWELVKNIGIAFAAWRIGSSVFRFLNHGGWLMISRLLGRGSTTLPVLAGKVGSIASSLQIAAGSALTIAGAFTEMKGVMNALGEEFDWKNLLEIGGGSASVIAGATIVGKIIGKILGKTIPGTFIGMILSGLTMLIPSAIDLFKNGIDWENGILVPLGATLTGGGVGGIIGATIGSVGGPVGTAIGAAIGLGVGLIVDGIGAAVDWFNDEAIPAVEIFDETVSEATRNAVEPFLEKTKELSNLTFEWEIKGVKFADFSDLTFKINTIKERAEKEGRELTESEVSEIATIESLIERKKKEGFVDVTDATSKGNEIAKIAEDALNSSKDKDLKNLSILNGYLDPEAMSSIQGDLLYFYTLNEKELNEHKNRFNEILSTAAEENRSLTSAEWSEINDIQNDWQNMGIQGLSQTRVEAETIMRNLKDNTTRMSLEQAGELIKDAQKTRDETIKAAEDQYSSIKLWADDMLDVGAINHEQYAAIIKAAKDARNETISEAELQYQGIEDATKEKLGATAKYIDFETGNIKTNWEVFWTNVSEGWEKFWDGVSSKWNGFWDGISQKWSEFKKDFSTNWDSFWDGVGEGWKKFWTGTANFFIDIWNGIVSGLESAINWIVKALNNLSFKIPDWDVFGDLAGKNFGFNLKTVSLDKLEHVDVSEKNIPKVPYNVYSTKGADSKFSSYADNNLLGISKAIYDGFMAAQSEGQSSGGQSINVNMQVDGETIGKASLAYINGKVVQTGGSPLYAF